MVESRIKAMRRDGAPVSSQSEERMAKAKRAKRRNPAFFMGYIANKFSDPKPASSWNSSQTNIQSHVDPQGSWKHCVKRSVPHLRLFTRLICFSCKVLGAEARIHVYDPDTLRRMLMKPTRWDDFLSGSYSHSRQKPAPQGSNESLFSLLLEIERRLGAHAKADEQIRLRRRKSSKTKSPKRSTLGNLSRYIE